MTAPASPSGAAVSAPAIPELARHRRAIAAANRVDREWMEDERFDELVSLFDIVASHTVSAREAAFRRDRTLLGEHLNHARNGLKLTIQIYNLLPKDGAAA